MKLASHNSLSYVKPSTWWERLINFTAKCQSYDVMAQYDKGVRLFDIRVRRRELSYPSSYNAVSAHGLITYNVYVFDVLGWLNQKSTKDDPVYVQLNLENLKSEEDRDFYWFKELFNEYSESFSNIVFCGGYVKHPWHKIIDCEDPSIDQKNWEFFNYQNQPTTWGKIKCFFSNLLHFCPRYWAKKDNQKYKSDGTSAEFLMLDYIQYGEF